MSDDDDHRGPRLRVDRLAAAMDAARARARAAADLTQPPAGTPVTAPADTSFDRPAETPAESHAARPADRLVTGIAPAPGVQQAAPPEPAAPPSQPHGRAASSRGVGRAGSAAPRPGAALASPPGTDDPPPRVDPPDTGPLLLTDAFRASPLADTTVPAASDADVPVILDPAARRHAQPARPVAAPRAPHPAQGRALLSLSGVATDIGRYSILHDITLEAPKGAVTMLLGRNGAGKTTTLRTVMGLWRARAGDITLAGDRIDRWPTHRIARAGVGYVPESMCIFGDLTVAENIALGARSGAVPRDRLDWLTGLFPPLRTFWRSPAGNLSGGQKQMLALARALVEKRKLYLIDEPTKGLAPVIVDTVVAALRDLKLQGATILMVEQNFAVARALGDGCVVMDDGHVTWRGTMDDLARDAALQTRLLGLNLGDAA